MSKGIEGRQPGIEGTAGERTQKGRFNVTYIEGVSIDTTPFALLCLPPATRNTLCRSVLAGQAFLVRLPGSG
jgi:hypothetical protein